MSIPLEYNPIKVFSIKDVMPEVYANTVPDAVKNSLVDCIPAILEQHMPGKRAVRIIDRGQWDRRIFEVVLDSGEVVVVKFILHEEWHYLISTQVNFTYRMTLGARMVQATGW